MRSNVLNLLMNKYFIKRCDLAWHLLIYKTDRPKRCNFRRGLTSNLCLAGVGNRPYKSSRADMSG